LRNGRGAAGSVQCPFESRQLALGGLELLPGAVQSVGQAFDRRLEVRGVVLVGGADEPATTVTGPA
jgi:hypothetical protein